MRYLEWTSENGISVTIGHAPPYLIQPLPRDSLSSTSQLVRPPGMDGADEYNVTRTMRVVLVSGVLAADSPRGFDKARQTLITAFDPKRSGTLTYHTENGTYRLPRCRAHDIPQFSDRTGNACTWAVELTSLNALWEGAEKTASAGSTYMNFRFPLFLPKSGIPFALAMPAAIADNLSTVDIHPYVEIYDTRGQHVNIVNETTGAFLVVEHEVATDEKLTIDTENSIVSLWKRTENDEWALVSDDMINWLSLDSDMDAFVLAPGENRINLNNDVPTQRPIMVIRYRTPAVGV